MDLYPDSLVYMYCHLFGEDWVEKQIDPLFGRIPIDARCIEAPMADDTRLTEKSVTEQISVASFIWLAQNGFIEMRVEEERGWNFEMYDQVFCRRLRPLPDSPVLTCLTRRFDGEEASLFTRRKQLAVERGVACGKLVTGFRKRHWLRGDPYHFVCEAVRRELMRHDLFTVETEKVFGPFLRPKPIADREKMAPFELAARGLKADQEAFASASPELASTLEDNVVRSLLKMRCDEEYMQSRDAEGGGGESPI